jgi:hypothetical protein
MNEAIEKEENKRLFRELARRFHPDNLITGDIEKMKELNNAKDTDVGIEAFYKSLNRHIKPEVPKPSPQPSVKEEPSNKRPVRFTTDKEWERWLKEYKGVKKNREKKQDKVRKEQKK